MRQVRGKPVRVLRLQKRALMLDSLSRFKPLAEIAKERSTSKQAVASFFRRLQKEGLINAQRELQQAGKSLVERFIVGSNDVTPLTSVNLVRLHDICVNVALREVPLNWNDRRERLGVLAPQGVEGFKRWNVGKARFQEFFVLNNVRVRCTSKRVLFYLPEIYAREVDDAKAQVFRLLEPSVVEVERLLNVKLARGRQLSWRMSRQHYALTGNAMARAFIEAGFPCKVYDDFGRLRVIADNSKGLVELEAVNPLRADEDARRLKENISDVVVRGLSLRDLEARLALLEDLASSLKIPPKALERRDVT